MSTTDFETKIQRKADAGVDHGPDLAAEHDPEVSRRASNADLRRFSAAVQRKATSQAAGDVHAAAARGIDSPTTQLPHAERIQESFGPDHDVSKIQAHVGGDSAGEMGASAFASGNHAVFDETPDLHTAAHEAAHVVQQAQGVNLYGGVGEAGDAYEQQADAVADRVVAGEPAADLLGSPTAHTAASGDAVQHKVKPETDAQVKSRLGQETTAVDRSLDGINAALNVMVQRIERGARLLGDQVRQGVRIGWQRDADYAEQLLHELYALVRMLSPEQKAHQDKLLPSVRQVYATYRFYAETWSMARNQFPDDWGQAPPLLLDQPISEMFAYFGLDMDPSQLQTVAAFPQDSAETMERTAAKANLTAALERARLIELEKKSRLTGLVPGEIEVMHTHIQALHNVVRHSPNKTKSAFRELWPDIAMLTIKVGALWMEHLGKDGVERQLHTSHQLLLALQGSITIT